MVNRCPHSACERSKASGGGLLRWFRSFDALGRCRRGVTAVETALILPIFLVLTFGTFEMGLLYMSASILEGQVSEASRQIRTGNVQAEGDPIGTFRNLLCGGAGFFLKCDQAIIDVRTFARFRDVDYPEFVDEDGEAQGTQFFPGGRNDIVSVRVAYRYDIVTPIMEDIVGDSGGGFKILHSSTLFRNEPF